MKQSIISSRAQTSLLDEIIVDNFAGGGGASTGIELATGRVVNIAINHDPDAILMHKTNHPYTEHIQASVWDVDVEAVCRGRPVGLAWFSPDCKHFSKAKGGPLVSKNIRGLSWVVIKWCLAAPPRVILMENVEEIKTWGPLIPVLDPKTGRPLKIVTYLKNGKPRQKTVVAKEGEVVPEDQLAMMPDPERRGETFQGFISILTTGIAPDHPALLECCKFLQIAPDSDDAKRLIKGLGYDVEHKELVAADYGAPTSRKRFVLVARCDGRPIIWPERTHAPADSPEVKSGRCKPWRSAAEIIDWTIPCPSIFATKEEIMKKYGFKAVRPLAESTQRRAIRGVNKYTIKSAEPFIIPTGYGERQGQKPRTHDIHKPLPTVVSTGKQNLCRPVLSPVTMPNTCNSVGSPADQPVHTITSAGNQMLVTPVLSAFGIECNHSGDGHVADLNAPQKTITAKHTGGICTANLLQYHAEKTEGARVNSLEDTLPTVDGSNRHAVVLAHLTEYYGNGQPVSLQDPLHTVTSHDRNALTTAVMQPFHAGGYNGKGNSPADPVNTVTSSGGQSLVTAHVAEFKGHDIGQSADKPLRTITASAGEFAAVHTKVTRYAPGTDLGYWPQVRELLNKYCGYTLADDEVLLIRIQDAWYFIFDIGLRMLTPKELYAAMGFPLDYIIERDYTGKPYPKTAQVARCGNAVCPPMATAVVRANLPEWCGETIETMEQLERLVAM